MPKRSTADTQASRERILISAGRLMRERGYAGVGIDTIVAHAGLTPGAFYTHFPSKQALFAAVVQRALEHSEKYLPAIDSPDDVEKFIAFYLSDKSVRALGTGCIVAAMSADLSRQGKAAREAAAAYVLLIQTRIEAALKAQHGSDANAVAWQRVAQAIGAVIISRLFASREIAIEVLNSVKQHRTTRLH